ncbi:unnamed protein product, partial [Arctogadus glacialis]
LGLKVTESCTSTSDAVCEVLDGSFCSDSNGGGCRAAQSHTVCSPGQYIGQRGTADKDTECLHCTDGTFSNGTSSSCQNHTKCESVGLNLMKPGTDSTDSECGEHGPERGLVAGIVIPGVILDGDLEDDVDAADTSTQTPTTADPSYQSHRVKSMERGGSPLGSLLKVKRSCSSTSDAVCEVLDGFFCSDSNRGGCRAAQRHRLSCSPGQYIGQRGTADKDTECLHCTDGTFSNGTSTSCQNHTKCESVGLNLMKPGTDSTDSECGEHGPERGHVAGIVSGVILVILALMDLIIIAIIHRKNKRESTPQSKIEIQSKELSQDYRPTEQPAAELLHPSAFSPDSEDVMEEDGGVHPLSLGPPSPSQSTPSAWVPPPSPPPQSGSPLLSLGPTSQSTPSVWVPPPSPPPQPGSPLPVHPLSLGLLSQSTPSVWVSPSQSTPSVWVSSPSPALHSQPV